MKIKHILPIIAVAFLAISCGPKQSYKSLEVSEFNEFLQNHEDAVLVDVRSAEEHAQGHIPGTDFNINVLQENFDSLALDQLPKDKTIAIYCRGGRRSKEAADILVNYGFQVVELNTGFISWEEDQRQYSDSK